MEILQKISIYIFNELPFQKSVDSLDGKYSLRRVGDPIEES